jgi:uncharacterized protein
LGSWDRYQQTMKEAEDIYSVSKMGNLEALRRYTVTMDGLNKSNFKGHTPLMLAAYYGHQECVVYLLEKGSDPNFADSNGNSILMGVAFKGFTNIAKLLVEHGARVDYANGKGQTALNFAQMFGRTETVSYLKKQLNQPESFFLFDLIKSWGSAIFPKGASNE